MKTFYITIAMLLINMASFGQIAPEFLSYYDDFIADAQAKGVDLSERYSVSIEFNYFETKGIYGVGKVSHDYEYNIIYINPIRWESASDVQRKIILYHELGHCLLFRPHVSNKLSIMNEPAISEEDFLNNESKLIDELFLPFSSPDVQFQYPLGINDHSVEIKHGDLILIYEGVGEPLKPFLFNHRNKNSMIYKWINYHHIRVFSVIDFTDPSKMLIRGGRVIQINSTRGGISLVQNDILKQPHWDGSLSFNNDYLVFHYDNLNTTFDSTPFADADFPSVYHDLSGEVRIDERIANLADRIIVITLDKYTK